MTITHIKAGTRVEVLGFDMQSREVWEPATVRRWTKAMGERDSRYLPVVYLADNARLLTPVSRIRVTDNRT